MTESLRDLRYGVRRLTRSPTFTVVVILTLALGIGANTTIFSIVNSLLLRPLPYPEPGQLVTLNHVYPSVDLVAGVSAPGFRDYRDRTQSFENVAITRRWSANLTGIGEPVRVLGSRVSADYIETFGIAPTNGRSFLPQEDEPGSEHVVVISDGFWKSRLGGRPDVIGSSVSLNDESYHVIGVMPAHFEDFFSPDREFWVPIALAPEAFGDEFRNNENQQSVARIKTGVTVEAAAQEMTNLAETIKAEYPGTYQPGWTVRTTSLDDRRKSVYRTTLLVLLGAVGFVLLMTCANVANLLLARGIGFQKEIAIRRALGANRTQVIRQLLTESTILSFTGGAAGLLLAVWGIRGLVVIGPQVLATTELSIDGRVLMFTLGVSVLAGALFGLAPAAQGAGGDIQRTLREGGQASRSDRSGHGLRRGLIVAEFALAVILLAGSGLMIRSISQLRKVDPGFNQEHILAASIRLPEASYPEQDSRVAFFDQLMSELEAVPGIRSAATTSVLPFGGAWGTSVFSVEGYVPDDNNPAPWGDIRIVSPGFARTLEVPLVTGRFFDRTDGPESQPVAAVDEEMAKRFWPDENPIGKRITFDNPSDSDARWATVIGVVGHTMHAGLDDDLRIQLYFSSRQWGGFTTMIVVRTETEPAAMVSALRRTVFSIDPTQPISGVRIMEELVTESIGNRRLLTQLLTLFSGLAILLASIGIYGIMSQMVRERSRELGLRMALGATPGKAVFITGAGGLKLTFVGLVLGGVLSVVVAKLMVVLIYGVAPFDPLTLAFLVGVLSLFASFASFVPAARIGRMDPAEILREG